MSTMTPARTLTGASEGRRLGTTCREARLRAEFGALYPGLRAGEWEPAAVVADRVLAQSLLRAGHGTILGRVLLEAHFDFRHGTSLGGERHGLRLRRET